MTGPPWCNGRRWGPPWRRRGSIYRRSVWAFILVAVFASVGTFAVLAPSAFGRRRTGPPNLHLLFVVLAVAIAAGVFTAGGITRNLRRLRAAVERIDLRNLSPRVPVEGRDEVAALATAFNRMADRLESEERVRRQLLADVAHEVRHPLAVLRARLEAMQDGAIPVDHEQVLRLHEIVLGLGRLVGDLRDLSLADVGQLSLHRSAVDLAAMISELGDNFAPVAAAKGVELRVPPAAGLPAVMADPDRIRQVLVNLLANAVQHTGSGGHVEIGATAGGGRVRIHVSDTGEGIAGDDLPHVFDRFYRTDPSRSRAAGGSGLGLAIVRSLVELHGGSVRAESERGKGARFDVELPAGAGPPLSGTAVTPGGADATDGGA